MPGADAFSYGFYAQSGHVAHMERGYFAGKVVGVRFKGMHFARGQTLVLPYAVLEGLSGSPVLTYSNGVKLLGICHGSETQRVLAQEIVERHDDQDRLLETVHRVVEFGLAYATSEIVRFVTRHTQEVVVTEGPTEPTG